MNSPATVLGTTSHPSTHESGRRCDRRHHDPELDQIRHGRHPDEMRNAMTDGSVAALWRYPVKSMNGSRSSTHRTSPIGGVLGDRSHALVDTETGKWSAPRTQEVAQHVRLPAVFTAPPVFGEPAATGAGDTPGRRTAPAPTTLASTELVSAALGRPVTLATAAPAEPSLEEYWPDIAELDHQETVTDEAMPVNTFFDLATIHVLTTATINRLRELYPLGRFEVRPVRPNIVLDLDDDDADFAEESWVEANFGSARTSSSRSPTTARVAS